MARKKKAAPSANDLATMRYQAMQQAVEAGRQVAPSAPITQAPAPQTPELTATEQRTLGVTVGTSPGQIPPVVATATPSGETGATPPVPPTPPAPSGQGAAEALAFGLTESLIKAFPELQAVYDLFVANKLADARIAYYNTNYYKNLTEAGANRQSSKTARPGVYAQEFGAWKQSQRQRLINKGIPFTADVEALLEESYLRGDTDLQLDIRILDSGKVGTVGGTTLGQVNALKNTAFEQGVNTVLGQDYWNKVSMGLLSGSMTTQDVEEYIKQTAMSAYPAYAKGIESGRTFNMQTSALRQSIANLLEIDPDTIGNDNPIFKQLTNYVNPTSKQPEQIPLWEAEKIVKKRDEWLYTQNARNTFDSLSRAVLRDMGVSY